MVRPSGEALSDSHVPSSVSNSILRCGVRGRPDFFGGLASSARSREASRTRRKRWGINRNYKGSGRGALGGEAAKQKTSTLVLSVKAGPRKVLAL